MQKTAMVLAAAVLAGGVILNLDDSLQGGNMGRGVALGAENIQVSMPNEAIGFNGALLGEIAKPVANGFLTIKVVKVLGYSAKNKTKMTPAALTEAWKDKYDWCGPAQGSAPCAQFNEGDLVILTCFQNEAHLRYTKVVRQDGTTPSADMKTLVYKTVGDLKLKADVYRKDDAQMRPVLLWLHGGALIHGDRRGFPQDLRDLCRTEGYILVSAEYRLAPETKLPQIIEDLRDLIKWVNEKGPGLFKADASKVVVAGGSAGGYLTMMAGLCEPRPKALVSYYGYGDVDGPWYTQPSEFYRTSRPLISKEKAYQDMGMDVSGKPLAHPPAQLNRGQFYLYLRQNGLWTKEVSGFDPATEPRKLDPYCPVRNVTAKYPPILMIHGTADTDVPYQESADMAEALKKADVRHELITIKDAGHGLGGGDQRLVAQAYARAREFIKENLGAVAQAPK